MDVQVISKPKIKVLGSYVLQFTVQLMVLTVKISKADQDHQLLSHLLEQRVLELAYQSQRVLDLH